MLTELRPKHPDVHCQAGEIESVKKSMDEMVGEWKERSRRSRKSSQNRPDLQVAGIGGGTQADGQAKSSASRRCLATSRSRLTRFMQRINNVPGAEVQLGALDREYQTKKAAYDPLLAQQQKNRSRRRRRYAAAGRRHSSGRPRLPCLRSRLLPSDCAVCAWSWPWSRFRLLSGRRCLKFQAADDSEHAKMRATTRVCPFWSRCLIC